VGEGMNVDVIPAWELDQIGITIFDNAMKLDIMLWFSIKDAKILSDKLLEAITVCDDLDRGLEEYAQDG
jgi:hypothetical protein